MKTYKMTVIKYHVRYNPQCTGLPTNSNQKGVKSTP